MKSSGSLCLGAYLQTAASQPVIHSFRHGVLSSWLDKIAGQCFEKETRKFDGKLSYIFLSVIQMVVWVFGFCLQLSTSRKGQMPNKTFIKQLQWYGFCRPSPAAWNNSFVICLQIYDWPRSSILLHKSSRKATSVNLNACVLQWVDQIK